MSALEAAALPKNFFTIKESQVAFPNWRFNAWILWRLPFWVSRIYLGGVTRFYLLLLPRTPPGHQPGSTAFYRQPAGVAPRPQRLWSKVRAGICDHYHGSFP
jgi:hypothetical protein